ncbi:hypothetical protein [Pelagovum pacificum]|uniref:DUF2066 domain-containing protein n=1 Tax=Pelagovum pacificum TaxID=2588711 RepID=A0A5C5GH04_9RHOB|nr:hypothetical protein [Pelagovum pacificum]QQA42881.1 hypothetical protein I8N54_19265 [Pelagovum pacificum]TNY33973.1 hypothetical protein FHY64_12120 [Pelagovum pacificum]
MRRLLLWLAFILPTVAGAQESFATFARAVTNDAAVLARIDDILADPPVRTEDIGYYGFEDALPSKRALMTMLYRLSEAGALISVEDKSVSNLPAALTEAEVIAPDPENRFLTLPGFSGEGANSPRRDPLIALRRGFASHVDALNAAAAARGFTLIEVRKEGDELLLWPAPVAAAEEWSGVVLAPGVTLVPFDGVTYWSLLTYELMLDERDSALPDGLQE